MKKFILITIALLLSLSLLTYKFYNEDSIEEVPTKNIKQSSMLSMMIETEVDSGNYQISTSNTWPTDGYIFNSELSKCESGGTLSWDDTNKKVMFEGNNIDKCYVYFDMIPPILLTEYIKTQYTGTQGENNIYYHDSSLTNGAKDNSYRFAGSSNEVNNYICLGSSEATCPDDNLYRIIGMFGNQVKVIRANSIASMKWDNKSSNTWATSNINTYLTETYLPSLGTLAEKIETTTWKVGGNIYESISSKTPTIAYQNEIINPVTANTTDGATEYSAKIGLMYASDYGYAASPSAWSKTLYNYSGSNDNGIAISTINWLFLHKYEWIITRKADGSDQAFLVYGDGTVGAGMVGGSNDIRPSFYLTSSVQYISGSGQESDPIRIN